MGLGKVDADTLQGAKQVCPGRKWEPFRDRAQHMQRPCTWEALKAGSLGPSTALSLQGHVSGPQATLDNTTPSHAVLQQEISLPTLASVWALPHLSGVLMRTLRASSCCRPRGPNAGCN